MENEIYEELVDSLARLEITIRNFLTAISPERLAQIQQQVVSEKTYVLPSTIKEMQQLYPALEVIEKPFDGHHFFVATQKITSLGDRVDLGRDVDFVMVMPSIDAQIDFDTAINNQTPVVLGGTAYSHPEKTRTIYFKGTSTTLTGTLSIWEYWWD